MHARSYTNLLARLDEHNEYVRQVTPTSKFNMVELGQGWAPLCRILDLPVPAKPFPQANDADAVKGLELKIFREAAGRWLLVLGLPLALVIGVWKYVV
jgi:hypothetical protein